MNNLIYLLLAIVFETSATTLLKFSDGFTKLLPTLASIMLYILSFYCLSTCLKTVPIGIAYAIWSALGIVLITVVGIVAFKQTPDWAAIIGLLLVILGVGVINLFSKMSIHSFPIVFHLRYWKYNSNYLKWFHDILYLCAYFSLIFAIKPLDVIIFIFNSHFQI